MPGVSVRTIRTVTAQPRRHIVWLQKLVASGAVSWSSMTSILQHVIDESEAITQLIVRTSLKDRPAFDLLYKATSAKLFGVCLRVLNDRADAEEALQDIYIKIWNRADRFAVSELSPMSWLIAIARNQAIDRIRQRRKGVVPLDEASAVSDPSPGPEALTVAAGDARQIHKCLDELDADRAAAVRGAYMSGDSYAELAERYAVPLNTMRTWLRRSLLKLRECLER